MEKNIKIHISDHELCRKCKTVSAPSCCSTNASASLTSWMHSHSTDPWNQRKKNPVSGLCRCNQQLPDVETHACTQEMQGSPPSLAGSQHQGGAVQVAFNFCLISQSPRLMQMKRELRSLELLHIIPLHILCKASQHLVLHPWCPVFDSVCFCISVLQCCSAQCC